MSMETRHEDSDGSDIFWPGYVDATTNLILNLLFLLTILIVAVFMFALELGRTTPARNEPEPPPVAAEVKTEAVPQATTDAVAENVVLKREVKRLNVMLAQLSKQKVTSAGKAESVDATSNIAEPDKGLEQAQAAELEIIVRFRDEAIDFTPVEHEQVIESLQPIMAHPKTKILVEVPAGFSEAKRLGFYRAMAVRNLLIEMKMPKENIDVSVVEGQKNANASLVKVRSR